MSCIDVCRWIVIAMEFSMIVVAHVCFAQTRRLNRRREALIAYWEEAMNNLKEGSNENETTEI